MDYWTTCNGYYRLVFFKEKKLFLIIPDWRISQYGFDTDLCFSRKAEKEFLFRGVQHEGHRRHLQARFRLLQVPAQNLFHVSCLEHESWTFKNKHFWYFKSRTFFHHCEVAAFWIFCLKYSSEVVRKFIANSTFINLFNSLLLSICFNLFCLFTIQPCIYKLVW